MSFWKTLNGKEGLNSSKNESEGLVICDMTWKNRWLIDLLSLGIRVDIRCVLS